MRKSLLMVATAFSLSTLNGEEFRTWTDSKTKREVVAKLVEKSESGHTAKFLLKNLKTVDIQIERLSMDDQEYINKWFKVVEPENQLTVRTVKSGSGGKTLEIWVVANDKGIVVSGGCCRSHRIHQKVDAHKTRSFTLRVHDKYQITLKDDDGNALDKETTLKKTGVTKIDNK